jgi:hypothetical protein
MDDFPTINDRIHLQPQRLSGATTIFIGLYRIKQFFETTRAGIQTLSVNGVVGAFYSNHQPGTKNQVEI